MPRKSAAEIEVMATVSRLHQLSPEPEPPAPPAHLGEAEVELWNHLFRTYNLDGPVSATFVEMALSAHKRARVLREIIDKQGEVTTKGKSHPLLGAERGAWRSYFDGIRRLKLAK